jgi:hypothetical protein
MQTSIRAVDQTGTKYDLAVNEEGLCVPDVGDEVVYSLGRAKVESRSFEYVEFKIGPSKLLVLLKVRLQEEQIVEKSAGFQTRVNIELPPR